MFSNPEAIWLPLFDKNNDSFKFVENAFEYGDAVPDK